MEAKMQNMESKKRKKISKGSNQKSVIRVSTALKDRIETILKKVNKNKIGRRKVKVEELFEILISEFRDEHEKTLRESSMNGDDRKEMLRQKYIEKYGEISKAEFTDFMMKPEYIEFMRAQGHWTEVPLQIN